MGVDLVLSSGFLAFAAQTGFLQGIEQAGIEVDALCGTSSGALAGALWLAGGSAAEVGALLSERRPLAWVRPHLTPWRGALSLSPMLDELRRRLPARFEDLDRPFGVGVILPDGTHGLIRSGSLPEAVAASCAIPRLFLPVVVDGTRCADGGLLDRTAIAAWRHYRGPNETVVHLVDSPRNPGPIDLPAEAVVVRSPASGASLWSLGDFDAQRRVALASTLAALGT